MKLYKSLDLPALLPHLVHSVTHPEPKILLFGHSTVGFGARVGVHSDEGAGGLACRTLAMVQPVSGQGLPLVGSMVSRGVIGLDSVSSHFIGRIGGIV